MLIELTFYWYGLNRSWLYCCHRNQTFSQLVNGGINRQTIEHRTYSFCRSRLPWATESEVPLESGKLLNLVKYLKSGNIERLIERKKRSSNLIKTSLTFKYFYLFACTKGLCTIWEKRSLKFIDKVPHNVKVKRPN